MSYTDFYSEEITKKLSKLKKKSPLHYRILRKKMDQILEAPEHKYKELQHAMKGIQRVHIGHFVLTFRIDSNKKIVSFEDYEHHDKVYYR